MPTTAPGHCCTRRPRRPDEHLPPRSKCKSRHPGEAGRSRLRGRAHTAQEARSAADRVVDRATPHSPGAANRGGRSHRGNRAPGVLRRDHPGYRPIRDLDPRRTSRQGRVNRLQRALYLLALASLLHASSRPYYDRKHARGKRHNQSVIALARRGTDALFAMLWDGIPYQDPTESRDQ